MCIKYGRNGDPSKLGSSRLTLTHIAKVIFAMQVFEERISKSRKEMIFVLAAAAIILFIRKTDGFTSPQFWAEDGTVVFLEQCKQGFSAILNTYAGYMALVPRIVGLLSDLFFPYSAAPYVYNDSCFILTMLVIVSVYAALCIGTRSSRLGADINCFNKPIN